MKVEEGAGQVEALRDWLAHRDAEAFPYEAVLEAFHRVGKHFVDANLLEALDGVRAVLPGVRGSTSGVQRLERFLDAALDKRDGRYDYPTYLALSLLPLPAVDDLPQDVTAAERRYDRLFLQLIADALRFEVDAATHRTGLLPQMRPDTRTTVKRCRLGLRAAGPAGQRLGLSDGVAEVAEADPLAGAGRLWANVAAALAPGERGTLRLSMLPVYVVHDEYQFIRVLQSFESTFALVAVQIRAAITALADGAPDLALRCVGGADAALREAAPLFSLLATMQVEAFRTFRAFTEGASAIQSRNYKIVESLCRRPDSSRLDSIAYHSVPEVRGRVLAGQATLDGAFGAARAAGRLRPREADALQQEMTRFASTLLQWRRTHYRLAVRMLGERTGTGYTQGPPYLASVQEIPVFPSLAEGENGVARHSAPAEAGAAAQAPQTSSVRGHA